MTSAIMDIVKLRLSITKLEGEFGIIHSGLKCIYSFNQRLMFF